jgi:peptide/nickel transport system substrate-binding protein
MRHTTNRARRSARALIGALATLSLLAGCAGAAGTASEGGDPVSGGTLQLDLPQDTSANPCLDPIQFYGREWQLITGNSAERLVDMDPETGEIVPWLADSWEVSADGLDYTFELKQGITFANGEEFNADAVKTAFDTNLEFVEENPSFGWNLLDIDGVETSGEHTVTISLSQPDSAFLSILTERNMGILSPSSYALSATERCQAGISSTAAYQVESFVPFESIVFVRRDDYVPTSALATHDGAGYLDRIEIDFVSELNVRVGNVTSGLTDVSWTRNPFTKSEIDQLTSAGLTVEQSPLSGLTYMYYPNVRFDRPLGDPKVREALQHSIDRASYADVLYGPDYPVAEGIYQQGTALAEAADPDLLSYDPELAASLLDEAGWKLGDDGYRYNDAGEKLTLVALGHNTNALGEELLQAQLREVGINLEIQVITVAERVGIGNAGDYDLTYTFTYTNDPSVIRRTLEVDRASEVPLAQNAMSDADYEGFTEILGKLVVEQDDATRAELSTELQQYVLEHNAAFPLYDRQQQAAFAPDVHGAEFTADGMIRFHDLWLDR